MNLPQSAESPSPPSLPEVYLSDRTQEELLAYFEEVSRLSPEIQVKSVLEEFENTTTTLQGAQQGLIQRHLAGVQLRYTWRNQSFIDTILAADSCYRIIRMAT